MRFFIFIITLFIIIFIFQSSKKTMGQASKSFYDHNIKTIDGVEFDLSTLKGKKLLVVNVASKCGLTSQYKELQQLYEEFGGKDFEILAFPSNDFGAQEPGSNLEISSFCKKNYGVSFLVFEKISVKGEEQHPIYQWLTNKNLNGKKSVSVTWNFQKFLIDKEGNWSDYLLPTTSPNSKKVRKWLQN